MRKILRRHLTYTRIITIGFILLILTGALLLTLPISSNDGTSTPFFDSLFTATSASCVTGLIVYDTYTHWSLFGQIVIICLIQIGGIGFMTIITMFSMFLRRKIGLAERQLLVQSAGTMQLGGVVRLIKKIIIGTIIVEGAGAILLAIRFCPDMGFFEGVYNAVFHSVSAFCNAGFDIMGKYGEFSSLTVHYAADPIVNITIMLLIIIGGLGFIVWSDVLDKRFRFKKLELHSKIVLTTTACLIFGGALLFYIFEYNYTLAGKSQWHRIIASFFQSVTTRTAGFNTIPLDQISESSTVLSSVLMFIGGSPGSTAGGIKTTTFIVLILSAVASALQTNNETIFKKRLAEDVVRRANAVFIMYMAASVASVITICYCDNNIPIGNVIFEVASAIGTVGLTTGITPTLSFVSQLVLILLMFFGRVGAINLMLSLSEKRTPPATVRPVEKIMIG